MTKRIYDFYVASSWRNDHQPGIVRSLKIRGWAVYDFRDPEGDGSTGFQWSAIDPDWQRWGPRQWREALNHPIAKHGFHRDMDALESCRFGVLVLPCGRSAHLEAGWLCGAGVPVYALVPDGVQVEPELMYGMIQGIHTMDEFSVSECPVCESDDYLFSCNECGHSPGVES